MAAAEARAAWQRAANRCFVQEDAKRAPKLACVPSLSKQVEKRPSTNNIDDFAPPTANSLYSNLSSDSRWWLHLQPNYIHQQGLTNEQVNTLEVDGNSHQFVDIMDSQSTVKVEESYEFVEMDCVYKKEMDEFSLDSEFPHWMEIEKSHDLPWWRLTDRDDLASYVAQKSHDFIENCDLPSPQHSSLKRDPDAENRSPHKKDENFTSFGISKPQKCQCRNSATVHGSQSGGSSGLVSPLSTQNSGITLQENPKETTSVEMDQSKRKLLEALRHSQTRAREAEAAAKQAYAEKEHVVKLIFKQASQLFAYKQWLYLLQLENLYNQIKTSKIITPAFPTSPWQVSRNKTRRNLHAKKKSRAKRCVGGSSYKHDLGKYAVALAVGLGLVGAGLFLGWTVGWMFI